MIKIIEYSYTDLYKATENNAAFKMFKSQPLEKRSLLLKKYQQAEL